MQHLQEATLATSTFQFRAPIARRIIDPNFKKIHGTERHLFLVPVQEVPDDLPLDPNARRPNTNKRVYKKVEQSLLNKGVEPGTFHLKNHGLIIVARSVKQLADEDHYEVKLGDGHGILDGGHTYQLITKHKKIGDLPENQYVQIEVRIGLPDEWIPELSGGLNTSVQVQDMSLDHLAGAFDWIKKDLESEPYFKEIAWSENDPGAYDARDIISLMYLFNVDLYPNDQDDLPIAAYEKKSEALKAFERDADNFKRMRPILKDILELHDTIAKQARDIWNESKQDAKAGRLAFMDEGNGKDFKFHFIQESGPYQLYDGALYPILGAFRWYVERDAKTQKMRWRKGFKEVLKAWQKNGAQLLRLTKATSDQLGRNPNAIGKSRPHWTSLHTTLSRNDLLAQQA
jgi:hypothetical protein